MNHELVHVAQGDLENADDRRWRRCFSARWPPSRTTPNRCCTAISLSRDSRSRAGIRRRAEFIETWMSGGLGRAQGGYDEMVFRAMVRDGAHFYDPLGLESRGVRSDFQIGANAYLYGTDSSPGSPTPTRPEKVLGWIRRDEGSERSLRGAVRAGLRHAARAGLADWVAFEHEFQRKNLAEIRKHPITPYRRLVDRPSAVSPGCTSTRPPARSTAAFARLASSRTSARSTSGTARSGGSPTSSAPCSTA